MRLQKYNIVLSYKKNKNNDFLMNKSVIVELYYIMF